MGDKCFAPYAEVEGEDAMWFPAVIRELAADGVHVEVEFEGYGNLETVRVADLDDPADYPTVAATPGDEGPRATSGRVRHDSGAATAAAAAAAAAVAVPSFGDQADTDESDSDDYEDDPIRPPLASAADGGPIQAAAAEAHESDAEDEDEYELPDVSIAKEAACDRRRSPEAPAKSPPPPVVPRHKKPTVQPQPEPTLDEELGAMPNEGDTYDVVERSQPADTASVDTATEAAPAANEVGEDDASPPVVPPRVSPVPPRKAAAITPPPVATSAKPTAAAAANDGDDDAVGPPPPPRPGRTQPAEPVDYNGGSVEDAEEDLDDEYEEPARVLARITPPSVTPLAAAATSGGDDDLGEDPDSEDEYEVPAVASQAGAADGRSRLSMDVFPTARELGEDPGSEDEYEVPEVRPRLSPRTPRLRMSSSDSMLHTPEMLYGNVLEEDDPAADDHRQRAATIEHRDRVYGRVTLTRIDAETAERVLMGCKDGGPGCHLFRVTLDQEIMMSLLQASTRSELEVVHRPIVQGFEDGAPVVSFGSGSKHRFQSLEDLRHFYKTSDRTTSSKAGLGARLTKEVNPSEVDPFLLVPPSAAAAAAAAAASSPVAPRSRSQSRKEVRALNKSIRKAEKDAEKQRKKAEKWVKQQEKKRSRSPAASRKGGKGPSITRGGRSGSMAPTSSDDLLRHMSPSPSPSASPHPAASPDAATTEEPDVPDVPPPRPPASPRAGRGRLSSQTIFGIPTNDTVVDAQATAQPARPSAVAVTVEDTDGGADDGVPPSPISSPLISRAELAPPTKASGADFVKVGRRCRAFGYDCKATIRFVGAVKHRDAAIRVGMALDQPDGKNDGSDLGVRFFDCAPKHGVFALPYRVYHEDLVVGVRCNTPNHGEGTVRYIGKVEGHGRLIMVGIELDRPLGTDSPSPSAYFPCPARHGVFLEPRAISIASGADGNSAADSGTSSLGDALGLSPTPPPPPPTAAGAAAAAGNGGVGGGVGAADVGKRVSIRGFDCNGTLRFFGPSATGSYHGNRCGIELDDSVGVNNGTAAGHRYFECDDNYGIMERPDKVAVLADQTAPPPRRRAPPPIPQTEEENPYNSMQHLMAAMPLSSDTPDTPGTPGTPASPLLPGQLLAHEEHTDMDGINEFDEARKQRALERRRQRGHDGRKSADDVLSC